MEASERNLKEGQIWADEYGGEFVIEALADSFLNGPTALGRWQGSRSGSDHLREATLLGGSFTLKDPS